MTHCSRKVRKDEEPENLAPVLQEAIQLVFKSHLSPSTACLQTLFCQVEIWFEKEAYGSRIYREVSE